MSEAATLAPQTTELVYELEQGRVFFALDEDLYPRDAIFGAAYLFVDRCWVFLTRPADGQVGVRLRAKDEQATEATLTALAGEFANELLNQVVRIRVAESTSQIREFYMAKAFFADQAQSSIDALLAELDAEELAEDDLAIEVPWEDPDA